MSKVQNISNPSGVATTARLRLQAWRAAMLRPDLVVVGQSKKLHFAPEPAREDQTMTCICLPSAAVYVTKSCSQIENQTDFEDEAQQQLSPVNHI